MSLIDDPKAERRPRIILPRWAGAIICGVGMPLVHGAVPWAISLLTVRHGWVDHHPGPWNLAGLSLVAVGCAGIVWALAAHFTEAPRGWEFERTPKYLLIRGPYRFTRNLCRLRGDLAGVGDLLWQRCVVRERLARVAGSISNCDPARGTEPGSALRRKLSRVQARSAALPRDRSTSEWSKPAE